MKAIFTQYKCKFVKIIAPGVGRGQSKEICFYIVYKGKKTLIIFWVTIGPLKLKFKWKISDKVQKQIF
jgi:hypothetical protein